MEKNTLFDTRIIAAIITGAAAIIAAFVLLFGKTSPLQQKVEQSPGSIQAGRDVNIRIEQGKALTRPPVATSSGAVSPEVVSSRPREIDEKERRLNDFRALMNPGLTTHPSKPNIALIIESAKTESGMPPENALYNLLRSEKINLIHNIFKEELFKSRGFFKEIYEGDTELLSSTNSLSKIDYLILGRLSYSFAKGAVAGQEIISCNINFTYKVIGKKGEIIKSDSIGITGPGFSKDAALGRGLEMLSEKHGDRILKLPL